MTSMQYKISGYLTKYVGWFITGLMLLLPFLAFFNVTLGSYGFSQGLIIAATAMWLLYLVIKRPFDFKQDRTNLLFVIILLLSLVTTVFVRPENSAVAFGIKNNILPILVFFVCQIKLNKNSWLHKYLEWIVIIPGVIVALIAILQFYIIPPSFLETIGYNSSTIDPRQIIDGSIKAYRAFSTLGGPNQLGAYLLLPLSFAIFYGIKRKNVWLILSSLPIIAGIAVSFSRSAWIATVALIVSAAILLVPPKKRIASIVLTLAILLLAGISLFGLASVNKRAQNVLLHGSIVENQILGSDQQRITALSKAADLVIKQPFGHGIGSAGPASFQSSKPVITENWYLQIAYEIGIFGMLLYLFAFLSLLLDFYKNNRPPLGHALFAATVGILIANLFLHTWADGTLSILAFALYGLYKGRSA